MLKILLERHFFHIHCGKKYSVFPFWHHHIATNLLEFRRKCCGVAIRLSLGVGRIFFERNHVTEPLLVLEQELEAAVAVGTSHLQTVDFGAFTEKNTDFLFKIVRNCSF